MDLSAIKSLMELAGGPAFALEGGVIRFADSAAADLGLAAGATLSALLPEVSLPESGTESVEAFLTLDGKDWLLRTVAADKTTLCFLRPAVGRTVGPNESTLLHTAGSIRLALQDLLTALNGMADTVSEDPAAARQASLALRSVYRLRRTAGDLELLAALCNGSFRLCRRECRPAAAADELCKDLAELLQPAGRTLHWEPPRREIPCCLDWPLVAALLRELIANAAANTADGKIRLTVTQPGKNRLCFAVRNVPASPLPESLFRRHAAEQSDLQSGAGLGLSLVSAGAECHGGGLLLSREESGAVTFLLTLTVTDQADDTLRSPIQLPRNPDEDLVALSQVLPPECYRPEDLL